MPSFEDLESGARAGANEPVKSLSSKLTLALIGGYSGLGSRHFPANPVNEPDANGSYPGVSTLNYGSKS